MKVLMISSEYPPVIHGGLGRYMQGLVSPLAQKLSALSLLTAPHPECEAKEVMGNLAVSRPAIAGTPENLMDWVMQFNFASCESVLKEGLDFDLIHVHDWLAAPAGIALKELAKVPLIASFHATEKGRKEMLLSEQEHAIASIESDLAKKAEQIIVCSEYMKRTVQHEFGVQNAAVIRSGNAWSAFGQNKTEDGGYVFAMGRFVKEKGFGDLIKAFSSIHVNYPGIRLLLAGEGPLKDEYMQQAKELGVSEKLLLPGFLEGEALIRTVDAAHICVIPSLYEPFGLSALECMGRGKSVLSSSAGGLEELIIHQETGLLFEGGDEAGLVAGMEQLLQDTALREKLAAAALKESLHYTWGRAAGEMYSIYSKML
ncbi:glycosyltransferase family 4 protein [Metabacillus sp. GX 13764]|uniref:glycosyltransferase family 4 protein n=1 Tax=Metabacillus kandeliae TaxID=2900151 RepID=UPI001E5E28EA|nr:glycosyltransferase family 4 protein [Metabacillus kandeliae]MCD7033105.1 glycosyltransferase family 4 protein [Metabacillus kandeliae]